MDKNEKIKPADTEPITPCPGCGVNIPDNLADKEGQIACPEGCGWFPLKWAKNYQKFLEWHKKRKTQLA
jgi:hypothetical protein